MANKQIFNQAKAKKYVPIVARVHGKSHPEFHEVGYLTLE
jgi:hypothetical protein